MGDCSTAPANDYPTTIFAPSRATLTIIGRIRIGKLGAQKTTFIAGIRGVTVPSGVAVGDQPKDQPGMITSSARYKEAVKRVPGWYGAL
jgi:hypothetical protein